MEEKVACEGRDDLTEILLKILPYYLTALGHLAGGSLCICEIYDSLPPYDQ